MIKNVIFDIGNVLVDFRWRDLMEDLKLSKEVKEEFQHTVFGSKEFNLVWDNRDKLVEPYAYCVTWIEHLKACGLNVYLLSNYPRDVFALHANAGSFPFLDKVDGKVVSGFVKMVKPNADIYEHLMKEYQLEASECVFIDDREENIETARMLGMKGIVFKTYEQADADLNKMLGGSYNFVKSDL